MENEPKRKTPITVWLLTSGGQNNKNKIEVKNERQIKKIKSKS